MKRECEDGITRASKGRKMDNKICNVQCKWENCQFSVTVAPSEYHVFSDHLKGHADDFICSLQMEAAGEDSEVTMSCCCMWRECSWEACSDLVDLIRHVSCHVMFHGYHALLKALGQLVQSQLNIPPCQIDLDYPYHALTYVTSPFVCMWDNCKNEFICPGKYYNHVVHMHIYKVAECVNAKLMRIRCQWITEGGVCGQDFSNKHKLKEHIRVHTREKSLACPQCGTLFANRTKFIDHLSRQNEEAYVNFQCSHCLRRYASERLLRDHMRHHVNYLKCPHCDMTCPNPGSLKEHNRYRHADERPYACSVCELTFKAPSDLSRHEETHLENNYLCSVQGCNYSTKTSRSLQSHIMKHSAKATKSYGCHICNNVYTKGFTLTQHLKKKHNYCWPSGHPRFRYIEHEDGLYRLQMVRFQSVELTEKLQQDGTSELLLEYEIEESNDTASEFNLTESNPDLTTNMEDLSSDFGKVSDTTCGEL